jgi:hypothetical protein
MKGIWFTLFIVICFSSLSQTFTLHQPLFYGLNALVTHIDVKSNGNVFGSTKTDTLIVEWDGFSWNRFTYVDQGFIQSNGEVQEVIRGYNDDIIFLQDSAISIFDGSTTTFMTTTNSELLDDHVSDILIDTNGVMYVAYENQQLSRVEDGVWIHTGDFTSGLDALNDVQDIDGMFIDRETNEVWILYEVFAVRVKDGISTTYSIPAETGAAFFASFRVTDMTKTDDGTVWFSCNGSTSATGGIMKFDGISWTHLNSYNSNFYGDKIMGIGSYGNTIVIPYYNELFIFDGMDWTNINSGTSDLPYNSGSYTEMVEFGNKIYVATGKGILEINGEALSVTENVKSQIDLFPNPTSGMLKIVDHNSSIINYKIFDIAGKLVLESSQLELNLEMLEPGSYLIELNLYDQTSVVKKIILT